MDSYTNQFLKEHHDFILKLKIKATDGTNQIRRIRLPRLADATGNVSYDELVGLSIAFTFPEGSPENYTVSLTYFDVDEDTVTIASTDELVDAVEQFAEKKVLRLTSEVKRRSSPVTPPSEPNVGSKISTREEPVINPQIKGALDTFAGILSMAVNHLQEGLAAPGAQPRATTVTVTPVREDASPDVAPAAPPAQETSPVTVPLYEKAETETEAKDVKPFIHGRHTCDSCLVTPIVGKRYHAINLPDYDLCQNCHTNYTGKEVKFEEAELERDRPFQFRWYRRREKIEKFQNKLSSRCERARQRCGRGPHARFAKHGVEPAGRRWEGGASRAPPFHPGRPGPPSVAPLFGQVPAFACSPGPPHWAHGMHFPDADAGAQFDVPSSSRTREFDDQLKEAIRRSLRDIAPKEMELFNESKPSFVEASQISEDTNSMSEEAASANETVFKSEVTSESGVLFAECKFGISVTADDADESGFDPEERKAMEDAMETDSVDSEKLLSEDDRKPAAVFDEHNPSSNTPDVSREDSFHSEAVGSGEIAEAVGATLDLVAGMISDMLSEADTPSKKSMMAFDNLKASPKEEANAPPEALIVEPAPSDEIKVLPSEEREWHLVGADGEEDFLQQDEEMARAAEMLGSALFHSSTRGSDDHDSNGNMPNLSDSHGNMSNLSDSFSVPSTIPSLTVNEAQRSRWSTQLMKLQELGFEDEAHSVEILERLEAANIGVDSEDDISVTQVVDAILEQK